MQRAFIVKIDIDQGADIQMIIDDITESVSADGYNVISVAAWSAPSEAPALASSLLGGGPVQEMNMSLPGIDSIKL